MPTSFHMLSNISFTNALVQHYIENDENPSDRTSTDNDKLWNVISVSEYLKNIQNTFCLYTK
jgi:hypothetical protein